MPVIKSSRVINRAECTIYGADAEMTFPVINNAALNRLVGGDSEKIIDDIYKSLSDNERTSYIAASNISIKILKNAIGIDITGLYDVLKDFENRGEFYSAYREHVIHQWRVFILGLYIIETNPAIKEAFSQKHGDEFIELWAVTALCHDIGYLMERGEINNNEYAVEIVKLLNSFEDNTTGLSVFCPELNLDDLLIPEKQNIIKKSEIQKYDIQGWRQLFNDRDNDSWKLSGLDSSIINFEKYYQITTSLNTKDKNRPCFIDHGIASAAILLYLMERKEYWKKQIEKNQYMPKKIYLSKENQYHVCQAIALHNVRPDIWDQNNVYIYNKLKLNTYKIRWKQEPLAFLLILCDSLQEWGRPSRDLKNRLRKEMTSQDMHVISKNRNIYLCFPTDELAKSVSADSSYNRIIKPITTLLDYKGCIEMIEINDSEIGKYVDEVLWIEEYRKINTGDKVAEAYELYKKGREYGNATRWDDGKRLHIDAAKLFQQSSMNDWAARSLGRAAVDNLDLNRIDQANKLMEEAMELDLWQGTANYYWLLEHCIRKDEQIEIIEKYFNQMLAGMMKLDIINDTFVKIYKESEHEEKFDLLWDKLILLFTALLDKETEWPEWSKSDISRKYVLMAERYSNESKEYLKLAEKWYRKVGLNSYAAWTKSKCLFLECGNCINIEQLTNLLNNILEEGTKILQTPGGPKDIVRFSIKVNSFFYNILMYIQNKDKKYKDEAKVYCSAIDSFHVSNKFEYREQCINIFNKIDENVIEIEQLLDEIKEAVTELAWLEKNKMGILLR